MSTFYRVGGKQPRNIYRVTQEHPEGEYIGVFFHETDAAMAIAAMNTSWRLTRVGEDESTRAACGCDTRMGTATGFCIGEA